MSENDAEKKKTIQERIDEEAMRLVKTGGLIKCVGKWHWKVASSSKPGLWYDVRITDGRFHCECAYHVKGNSRCKHMAAIEVIILQEDDGHESGEPIVINEVELKCPKCGSLEYHKNGWGKRKRREPVQRYECNVCKKQFLDNLGFEKMHLPPESVPIVLTLFSKGLSPESIAQTLGEQDISVHRSTVQRWIDKHTGKIVPYTDSITPQVGGKWSADEKYKKIKGKKAWIFAVMDTNSRFILHYDVAWSKMKYDATKLFEGAWKRAGRILKILITDGLIGFSTAFKKVFSRYMNSVVHIREIHIKNERSNNNKHERFNGELADRFNSVRGLQSKNSSLIHMTILHHNFIRPHSELGGITPAEAAGIKIMGVNKWRTLIQNAALAAT